MVIEIANVSEISTITSSTGFAVVPVFDPGEPQVPQYPATILGVWRFNNSLTDEVQNNDFVGLGVASYTSFQKFELLKNRVETRSGLKFEIDKTFTVSTDYIYSTNFTVAFWWFSPGVLGFTRHVNTKELEPKVAPLIAKSDSTITSTETHLQNCSFVITESGYSTTQNVIKVYLSTNGSTVSHIIASEPFEPGLKNVLITFIPDQSRLRIDIDGRTGILHSAPESGIQKTGRLVLNSIVPGFLAHKTQQENGYIFDLVFSNYASLDNEALKFMRYGYEHISYDNLFDTRFAYFGFSYSQPTTVTTNQIFVDGDNIFAARSNGEIVKGGRPVWDKEFSYPDRRSISLLNVSETDGVSRFAEPTTSGLLVQGATIRI